MWLEARFRQPLSFPQSIQGGRVVAWAEGMVVAVGAVQRSRRSLKTEFRQPRRKNAVARANAGQHGVAISAIVDVLFGAAGHVHRQRQRVADLRLVQAHGHRRRHRGGHRTHVALVVQPALALPVPHRRLNGIEDVVTDGQRRDQFSTAKLQMLAQRQQGGYQLRGNVPRQAAGVVHLKEMAQDTVGPGGALGRAAAAVSHQAGLLARHPLRGEVRRQPAQAHLVTAQRGAQSIQYHLAGAQDRHFTQVFVAQVRGVRGDDVDGTTAILRAHGSTSLPSSHGRARRRGYPATVAQPSVIYMAQALTLATVRRVSSPTSSSVSSRAQASKIARTRSSGSRSSVR